MFDFPDDPQKQALLYAAMGLLSGSPNGRKNFGADVANAGLLGMQGYNQGRVLQAKLGEEQQQAQMRNMQMEAIRQAQTDNNAVRGAFSRNITPGQPQMQPTDYETPSGPASPSSLNLQGLQRDLLSTGPAGLSYLSQIQSMTAKDRQKLGKGEVLVEHQNDGTYKNVASGAPDLPPGMRMGANGPEYIPEYIKGQSDIKAAGRPSVDVKVNSFTPASEEAQREFMKSTRATYDNLKAAPVALANIDKAKALIPAARGFMGPGGEPSLEAVKFLNNRLGMNINPAGVKSAEELRTRIFANIMDNLKKMDAQPSEMQQRVMMDSLGRLGTDPNALPAVLDAFGDTIKGKVDLHNQEVQGAVSRGVKFPYDPLIKLGQQEQNLQPNLTAITKARQAIKSGADPEAVRQRLRQQGYSDAGL